MRKQLLTAATATTASFIAVIGGLAPAVSAESPIQLPELEVHIPTVGTVPDPVPVPMPLPEINPELLGSLDLIPPTIPQDPPVPPGDDDGPVPFIPELDLCLNLDHFCPPEIDDFVPIPLPAGDDDPGDDQPGDDDPSDNPGDNPGETPTDEPGNDDGGDDDPGDTPTDDPGDEPTVPDSEVPDGNSVPTDIDEPVPGNPTFTG